MVTLFDRWQKREQRAWTVPEALSPSEWAQQHRVLSRTQSSRPGPWPNSNAPYLAGIMDLARVRKPTPLRRYQLSTT